MENYSVEVTDISKRYPLVTKAPLHNTFVGNFISLLYRPFKNLTELKKLSKAQDNSQEIDGFLWALKDINFKSQSNEIIGIVGTNGSGKSTLLKILSKITRPTIGNVRIKGKVASILEVGTGFHHELTGKENIYLNGSVMGMKKHEIDAKYDEIINFSGINEYIDTPIKRYSSGMRVRLAFSVAAHLDPDILIVDEVLAVGDVEFQKKCLGKIGDVAQSGRTVFFVSHDLNAVMSLCNRVIWIDKGKLMDDGEPKKVVQNYIESVSAISNSTVDLLDIDDRDSHVKWKGDRTFQLTQINLKNQIHSTSSFSTGDKFIVNINFKLNDLNLIDSPVELIVKIQNQNMNDLLVLSNLSSNTKLLLSDRNGLIKCTIPKLPLGEGIYNISLDAKVAGVPADKINGVASFEVTAGDFYGTGFARSLQSNFYTESIWEKS
tara:strand:- start:1341 stop:2642 length:1302 start_codon:yes stop_codon:yes gene_type:complete